MFSWELGAAEIRGLAGCPHEGKANPAKLAVENFLSDVASTGAIRAVLLRYFNAVGADSDSDIGEAHTAETHLVPLAIQAALDPSRPLSVFGPDYPTADGICERDYVHVEDLAEAHIQALGFLETTSGSHAFNLGTGYPVSVRQVPQAVERVLGTKVPTIEAPRRAGDPPRLFAGRGLAERDLGWVATRSDIDRIVGSAAQWHLGDERSGINAAHHGESRDKP